VNWTWTLRARDGGMNGLEFAKCTTAGGHRRVLVHAAPRLLGIEVFAVDGTLIARGDIDRDGDYSPMTLISIDGEHPRRDEVWPDESLIGLPVLLAGGEAARLLAWYHAPDHAWWRWTVEFSNHVGRPDDWQPPREGG
jgi:hypothetical protein